MRRPRGLAFMISVLQMRRPRPTRVKWLARSQMVPKGWRRDWNPGLTRESLLLSVTSCDVVEPPPSCQLAFPFRSPMASRPLLSEPVALFSLTLYRVNMF